MTKVATPGGGRWIIANGSMGNHGSPPVSPEHLYHVEHWRGSRSTEAETHLSLRAALDAHDVPEQIKTAIRALPNAKETL